MRRISGPMRHATHVGFLACLYTTGRPTDGKPYELLLLSKRKERDNFWLGRLAFLITFAYTGRSMFLPKIRWWSWFLRSQPANMILAQFCFTDTVVTSFPPSFFYLKWSRFVCITFNRLCFCCFPLASCHCAELYAFWFILTRSSTLARPCTTPPPPHLWPRRRPLQ
jgi:hypothetical protein